MAPETGKSRVLRKAAERVGSVETLAERLNVPVRSLKIWLEGFSEPPDAVFLAAVDIVLDDPPHG